MAFLLRRTALIGCAILVASCSVNPDSLRKTLTQHPEILFEAMEKNPTRFAEFLGKVQMEARRAAAEKQQQEQAKQLAEELKSPKRVTLEPDRAVRGNRKAPIVLVVYSDFECPYCQRGYATVEELRKKYGEKMLVVYKHLPLDIHPMAMPAAKRFEAIAMQSADKAYRFHDEVFKGQDKLHQSGEKFLDEMAKKVGADMAKMAKDMQTSKVAERIAADMKEAQTFGVRGTPGFLVNGVTIRGAVPMSQFEEVLAKRPTYN